MIDVLKAIEGEMDTLGGARPGERVLVGISGGGDSICLLHGLHSLGVPVIAAHLDHGLRRSSWGDGRHVLRLASSLGVPAVAERIEPGCLQAGAGSLEDRARRARYRFLASTARDLACPTIAVGHTQDDQAETVLMHLLRGSGTRGLRGMTPSCGLEEVTGEAQDADLRLVRPLLGVPREATLAYCRQHRLAIRSDPTNAQTAYLRNRIRLELLPLLATYNPAVRQTLAHTADILASDAQALESLLGLVVPELLGPPAADYVQVDRAKLVSLPPGVQRVILREILRDLSGEGAEVGFQAVERARACLRSYRRTSLPGDVEMLVEAGNIVFSRAGALRPTPGAHPQLEAIDEVRLRVPFRYPLENGWVFEAAEEALAKGTRNFRTDARWETAFDAEAFGRDVTLRAPRPGDRMTPFGAPGSKKLSDLFQEGKVPAVARGLWPVVCQSGSVAWLVGLRRAEVARVGAHTRRVLRLRLVAPVS
jgi:tRNA(Ile)-lysidine synthase